MSASVTVTVDHVTVEIMESGIAFLRTRFSGDREFLLGSGEPEEVVEALLKAIRKSEELQATKTNYVLEFAAEEAA